MISAAVVFGKYLGDSLRGHVGTVRTVTPCAIPKATLIQTRRLHSVSERGCLAQSRLSARHNGVHGKIKVCTDRNTRGPPTYLYRAHAGAKSTGKRVLLEHRKRKKGSKSLAMERNGFVGQMVRWDNLPCILSDSKISMHKVEKNMKRLGLPSYRQLVHRVRPHTRPQNIR